MGTLIIYLVCQTGKYPSTQALQACTDTINSLDA